MRQRLLYKVCIVCLYVFLFGENGIVNGYNIPGVDSKSFKLNGKSHSIISVERDTLTFQGRQPADSLNNDKRSTGLLVENVSRGINTGFGESDYLVGIYQRRILSRSFFGEGRLAIGMIEDNIQKTRLILREYRLNYRFRQATDSPTQPRLLSPYLYLGAGIIYHKPVEITPPVDPRTVRLEGRLPSSSLFDFDSGLTPILPVGAGMNIRLDPFVNLNLQFNYKKVLNRIAIHGKGFHRSYFLGFTIGLNFSRGSSAKPPPVSAPQSYVNANHLTEDQFREVEEDQPTVDELQSYEHNVKSNELNIVAGEASRISFGQHSTNTINGELIRPPVNVLIEDRIGNLVNIDNTTKVTIALANEPGEGSNTLRGITTVTSRNGMATFEDLRIDEADEDYMLEAKTPGLSGMKMALEEIPSSQVSSVGFIDIEVDTVKTGQCYYSVQFGSYQTMGSAFSAVEEAKAETGHSINLYYNRRNGLYMVRTSSDRTLSETVKIARGYETSDRFPDVAVVSQCYEDPSAKPLPLSYQIQFGSFQNLKNAEKYAEELRKTYGIPISVMQTLDDELFRVRTRPYTTVSEARQVLEMLQDRGLGKDLFLTLTPETTRFAMNFEYNLHVGTYSREVEAFQQVEKLRSEVGFEYRVVADEEEENGIHLFLDARHLGWEDLLVIKKKIESTDFITQSSIIHLVEN